MCLFILFLQSHSLYHSFVHSCLSSYGLYDHHSWQLSATYLWSHLEHQLVASIFVCYRLNWMRYHHFVSIAYETLVLVFALFGYGIHCVLVQFASSHASFTLRKIQNLKRCFGRHHSFNMRCTL
eukprot:120545_1